MTMQQLNAAPLLRGLKNGPACAILLLFLANPGRSLGTTDICQGTGWTKKPVAQALATLADYGILQHHGRYHGWRLSAYGRQLMLGETLGPEGETFLLPPCSSSDPNSPQPEGPSQLLQPPKPAEGENFHLPDDWLQLSQDLRDLYRIPPRLSQPALQAAYRRGDTTEQAHDLTRRWHDYCQTEDASTINYPPAVIAARLTDGTPPPETEEERNQRKEKQEREQWKRQAQRLNAMYGN
jgi:hypothetical protein